MIFGQWGKEWKVRHQEVAFWGCIALVVALISIRFEQPEIRFMIVDGFIALGVGVIIIEERERMKEKHLLLVERKTRWSFSSFFCLSTKFAEKPLLTRAENDVILLTI